MANITSYSSTFNNCTSLLEVPTNFSMAGATTVTSAFSGCRSLQYLPAITTPATSGASMFSGCYALKTIGNFTANSMTTASSMFNQCFSLDLRNTTLTLPSLVTTTSMFTQIGSPNITFGGTGTITGSVNGMFSGSNVLKLRDLTFTSSISNATDCGSMFSSQTILDEVNISTFTTNGTASTTSMFANCWNIKKLILGGFNQTFTIANCSLGAAELDALYTSLGTVTGKTITVTGNPGTTGDNPAIATAKGWTVTG
jgi:hypothetical protein